VQLIRLRLSGFRCLGAEPVELTFEKLTFLLGPNGTGKTTFLHALARMFGSEASLRRIVASDFHIPRGETPGIGAARSIKVFFDWVAKYDGIY
jgi:putative ATP-dependent endonuclease of OLD family